jgi:putative ABC transport system ATP-binding protein
MGIEKDGRQPARPAVELTNVVKVFGSGVTAVRAVDGLSFSLKHGDFWALIGPSGSGKSTILHLIAGLTPATSGTVSVDGLKVTGEDSEEMAALRRRRVGYVLQAFNLLSFLTAAENVAMPLVLDETKQQEVDARVEEALGLVGMSHRAHHLPSELSGGEQQRIAVARALVIRPAILLADEPTGNLDRAGGTAVMDLLQDINEGMGMTVLLVTHDPAFAACSQRVLRLVDGKLDQTIDIESGDATIPGDEILP